MADEKADCFPKAFKAGLCFMLERCILGECIRALKYPKGIQVSRGGAEGRAECDRGANPCPEVCVEVKLGRFLRAPLIVSEKAADGLGSPPDTRYILADLFRPQVSREGSLFGGFSCFEREYFSRLCQSIPKDGLDVIGQVEDV
jgi:hypothetical protein